MKTKFLALTLLSMAFFACQDKTVNASETQNSIDTLEKVSSNDASDKIQVGDKSQYDSKFLAGLSQYGEPLRLERDYILVGKDTVYFPTELKLGYLTVFKGDTDKNHFELKVKRINLTTFEYDFRVSDNAQKTVAERVGKATLGSLFFMGSETDEDDKTGDAYLSSEYSEEVSEGEFSARIGEKDESGKLRAKVKLTFKKGSSPDIDLDNCPTLREE